ncbi:MAG: hypothetical protein ACE5EM_12410 [Sphingomonadales bacterium]
MRETRYSWDNSRMIDWRSRLKQRMKEQGVTMKPLSLKAGQNGTYLRDIFRNPRQSPGIDGLLRVCEELNWTLGDLFGAPSGAINPGAISSQLTLDDFALRLQLALHGSRFISSNDLAKSCDIDKARMDKLASGKSDPTLDELAVIANRTGVDVEFLVLGPSRGRREQGSTSPQGRPGSCDLSDREVFETAKAEVERQFKEWGLEPLEATVLRHVLEIYARAERQTGKSLPDLLREMEALDSA